MDREELAGWLRLTLTPGLGRRGARALLAAFGLPGRVFAQPSSALQKVLGSAARAHALQQAPAGLADLVDRTLVWLQGAETQGATRRLLTLGDPGYPAALLEIADPPLLLYLIGAPELHLGQLENGIAVVGSRNPSAQGLQNARAFGRALAEAGLPVVSGLALGIDGAAHEGALEAAAVAGRPATVAVVGTGLDSVYPPQHRVLAHRIAARGLILSEYPLGTPPLGQNFPQRNRLIAGLARGTLVVEAALRSGSLITARLAAEQGREVFAIPGSIHAPHARGCHALIRQGAKLVESVTDVLEELRLPGRPPAAAAATPPLSAPAPEAGAPEGALLQALGFDPASLDLLAARTGFDAATLQAQLLELELAGRVARLPGGLFQRIARA